MPQYGYYGSSLDSYGKADITRLRNLLRNYRDHIITVVKQKNPRVDIVKIIDKIDEAIYLIVNNL